MMEEGLLRGLETLGEVVVEEEETVDAEEEEVRGRTSFSSTLRIIIESSGCLDDLDNNNSNYKNIKNINKLDISMFPRV
jgi:hypothetical protein